MDLSQAPAFVAAKMAMLSDACAAAATRADELTGQISHVRDRLNGRIVREGDHPAELRIEIDRLLAEQKALQARRPIDMGVIESCKAWLAALPPATSCRSDQEPSLTIRSVVGTDQETARVRSGAEARAHPRARHPAESAVLRAGSDPANHWRR